jgi:hypothetical protein
LFNPLNAELNPTCHLLALLEAYPILHVSGVRVNMLNLDCQHFITVLFSQGLYQFSLLVCPLIGFSVSKAGAMKYQGMG